MNRILHNHFHLVFILSLSTLLITCGDPEKDFKKAEKENTEQAFKEFIKKYPDNPLSEKAEEGIESIAFEKAIKAKTIDAYKDFMNRFPTSHFARQINSAIDTLKAIENNAWELARETDTIEGFEQFILNFPNAVYDAETEVKKWESHYIDPNKPYIDPPKSFASGNITLDFEETKAHGKLQGVCAFNLEDGRNIAGVQYVGEFFVLVPDSEITATKVSRYEGKLVNYVLRKGIGRITEPNGEIYLAEGRIIFIIEKEKFMASDGSFIFEKSGYIITKPAAAKGFKYIGRRPWQRK